MNTTMWEHAATQRNIERLKADGVFFVEPVAGELACKTVGTGKLEDVENIVAQVLRLLNSKSTNRNSKSDLSGENILITVGGTREAIDPGAIHIESFVWQNGFRRRGSGAETRRESDSRVRRNERRAA
jgi:phosphopantothenoylcysteine synthetase/decarboxylase